jgi:glycosyltransferase involved in cell wall biosynthesis
VTTLSPFNIIVPRIDRTGPGNVAVDVGRAAIAAGHSVRLLSLSGAILRDDLEGFAEIRRWRLSDLWRLRGVVHTHGLRPDVVGALTALLGGRTVITTLHNYFLIDLSFDHAAWTVRASWWIWRWAIGRLDHRICISRSMRRYYQRQLPGMSFDVCYNFREAPPTPPPPLRGDLAQWMARQREAGRIVMTYAGVLNARKNVMGLLEALSRHDELALVICGDGPLREALAVFASTRGMAERVIMMGHIARPDGVLAESDMLVLPSLAEGLPLVVLEAIRVGKPCLMSNIAVHRELAKLAIGSTFDRHRFSDFGAQAVRLAAQDSPERTRRLQALWADRFSPAIGFERYRQLLAAAA